MSRTTHTPTPWEAVGFHVMHSGRRLIAEVWAPAMPDTPGFDERRKANAEYIVRAVNNHEALLAALEELTLHIHDGYLYAEMLDASFITTAIAAARREASK